MNSRFQKSVYLIAIISFVFFCGCHSLPPTKPSDPEKEFDILNMPWEKIPMPTELVGDWYKEGKIYLTVGEDTLRVQGTLTLIESIERSDSYYRIIYKITQNYYSVYFHNLTEEDVLIVRADSTAYDEEGASALPVSGLWLTLTSTNPWIAAGMPGEMPGNWHIHDGEMEIEIARESVVLDGESWQIDSVQTNRTVDRLILKSGGRYKSLYFGEIGEYEMEALLVDSKADIQDRYGNVPGDWNTLYRWWDFIEKCRLYSGSRWVYDYSYQHYYDQVYDTSTPIDSIVQTDSLKGQLELEVTSSTIQEGTGSLTLQATFQIYEEKGRYYHVLKDDSTQVLTDSSWTRPGGVITEQYEIVLEYDTLWYRTEEGNIFFASRKLKSGTLVNIRAFVYPFELPREGFPEGVDIIGEIVFPHERIPISQNYKESKTIGIGWVDIYILVFGQKMHNYAYFSIGNGFQYVNYRFDDNDQRIRYGYGQYYNPYIKETSFSCRIPSFSPG